MTETRGGFGEHNRHSERGGHAGHAEGHSRRPDESAGSARQEQNERVIEDVRARLNQHKSVFDEPSGYQRIRIETNPNAPLHPDVAAIRSIDTLPRHQQQRAWVEYQTAKLLGGMSVAEYLMRHPEVDPDLFTADGRYLPYCRFGDLRYDLKKLGKFILRVLDSVLHPDDKKQSPPQLIVMHSEPDKESPEKPQVSDKYP